ncbi:MAG: CpXC domain-containing protein [Chloroflexota bacterium]|nr:CpXC domain-containing protein [Chloroflexota bacterium]
MLHEAKVSCPVCGSTFRTPVEQIIDVRVDPESKQRVLSGNVNVTQCPACGWVGSLNIPFLYHDPAQDTALLYLPVEAGGDEQQRQKAAGRLIRSLMDSLPQEERKGYLLQPETFISLDSLVRHLLKLEGVTDEDMERQESQQGLLRDLLRAEPEEWESMLAEERELVDEAFFYQLQYLEQMLALAEGAAPEGEKITELKEFLIAHNALVRSLQDRAELVQPFLDDPTRETLLGVLIQLRDADTIAQLVQQGLSLMDYTFFQQMLAYIEGAESEEERTRLQELRRRILDIREEVQAASEKILEQRSILLNKLLNTEEPLKMARSHRSELDEAFIYVFRSQLSRATEQGDKPLQERLKQVGEVLDQLMEQSMPPQVTLLRSLLAAGENEAAVTRLLQEQSQLLDETFFQLAESLMQHAEQEDEPEMLASLKTLLAKVRNFAPQVVHSAAATPPAAPELHPGETTSPSGLIISKR